MEFDPFAGPRLLGAIPSTETQREIWTAAQVSGEANLAYNESISVTLRGELDRALLEAALRDLVQRHEALRATFSGDGLNMLINESAEIPLRDIDCEGNPQALQKLLEQVVTEPFHLERGPLARAHLAKVSRDEHVLVFTAHHIVCDGWSAAVIVRDWAELYSAKKQGRAPALPPPPTFSAWAREVAAHRESQAGREEEAWWVDRFRGELPVLELPTDRPRPPLKTFSSLREDYVIGEALVARLKKAGAKERASLFAVLLAGWKVLLHRLSGQNDLVVGIPSAGQSIGGYDGLVGHCVNMLPLRTQLGADEPISKVLASVRTTLLDAQAHQLFTIGQLLQKVPVPRDPSRLPLVSVIFNVDRGMTPDAMPFEALSPALEANPRRFETYDLFLNAVDLGGRVKLECQYNTDLFDAVTVRRWLMAYERLLASMAAALESGGASVGALAMLSDEEQRGVEAWNAASALAVDPSLTVADLIEAQVRRTPDAVAVECEGRRITYAELDARANAVAAKLRELGVGRGKLVGLAMERSVDMLVGLFGVLKSGAGYVPLDPGYPTERLAFMVQDAGIEVLLTQAAAASELRLPAKHTVLVEELPASAGAVARDVQPEDVCYVIFTSGSTGKPKGVLLPHRAVVNLLESVRRTPGLGADDTVLAVTTLSFDIAVSELILPLTVGARIVVATRDVAADGARLLQLLRDSKATFLDATPATYRLLLGAGWSGGDLKKCICTGEAMPRDLAIELVKRVPSVWNGYGPTETCVWSTFYEVKAPVGRILIGKPVANTQCHVLDARRQPVLPGVVGELFIGGRGVALGYLNRPELTRERFVDGLYKTGDLVRLLPDGNLECLGRNDFQVKLRGFRIELGEIEDALTQHPAIRQAACIVRELRPGDPRLLGYVVLHSGQTVSDGDVRAHLKKTLPEYMVPQNLVRLEKMPLSPAGKIDRKALPDPDLTQARSDDFVAPRTPTETWLAAVWQELLRVGRVGITDDFFALGGHSLLAAQLMARLGRERDVKLSLRRLFEAPTVEKLAAIIDGRTVDAGSGVVSIPRRAEATVAPQSLMQRRLWYLDQLAGGDISYNAPSAFRLHGPLDVAALQRTFAEISRRHESLRTSFDEVDGVPLQRIDPDVRLELEKHDLPGVPEGERVAAVTKLLQEEADRGFDLRRAPLARAKLFSFAADDNVVFFMPHHIIWDGWSFDLFLEELSAIYGAFAAGKPSPLPEPEVQYGDFAAWHNEWLTGPELERQAKYWLDALKPPLGVLELPADRPRPARMSGEGRFEPIAFNLQEQELIAKAARRLETTPYMILLAGFDAVLHRYTGSEDLLIGTPVRGRTQPQIEKTLGFFVNTLVLRNGIFAAQRFDEHVAKVKERVLEAFAHPDMPFELLVERLRIARDPSRTPVYQAMFSFQEASGRSGKVGDLKVSQLHVMSQGAMTDLMFWLLSKREGYVGGLSYNADILDPPTARRFLTHFKQLVLEAAQQPSRTIGELKLVSDDELNAMRGWNEAARKPLPDRKLVHHEVLHQAEQTPDAVAVSHGEQRLTYRELVARAHAIAQQLHARGVRQGHLVGLCVERSADMVAAMLGILETGAAYVPLDPAYPEDRIAFMVEDAKLQVVVTEKRVLDELQLPQSAARLLLEEIDRAAPAGPQVGAVDPENAAYVIYTSGSTGKPKGVMVPHRAVTNFLQSMRREPGLKASDVVLAVTTLSFDIAVLELWLPLTCGARVEVAARADAGEAERLLQLMARVKPTLLQATPVTWRMLLDGGWSGDPALKALVGGEALPIDLARRLVGVVGSLWNMYGPTETTVWSTLEHVTAPVERVLVGRPIDNTSLYVLDARLQPVPLGVPGELYIGGDGVTTGYLHRPELTAERFVHDPFAGRPGARMYRTGDLARFMPDGRVECLGRNDGQVKVRGHRIEVGEIEARLATHPNVSEACVVARDDKRGEKQLVAYLVKKGDEALSTLELRKHVRRELPDYMVPNLFEELPALPRTPNGKVDRKALPAPTSESASEAFVAPRTANEKLVAEVWAQHLGSARAGTTDNFFDLGGHSLLAFKVLSELERRTGKRASARTLMLGTLEQVAGELPEAAPQARPWEPPPPQPRPEEKGGLRDRVLGRLKNLVKR